MTEPTIENRGLIRSGMRAILVWTVLFTVGGIFIALESCTVFDRQVPQIAVPLRGTLYFVTHIAPLVFLGACFLCWRGAAGGKSWRWAAIAGVAMVLAGAMTSPLLYGLISRFFFFWPRWLHPTFFALGGSWIAGGFFTLFLAQRRKEANDVRRSRSLLGAALVLIVVGIAIILGVPLLVFGRYIYVALVNSGVLISRTPDMGVLGVLYGIFCMPLSILIALLTYRELPSRKLST